VIDRIEQSAPPRRLTDLSKGQPADATLKNLLGALDAKLDLCARLAVFEWEADREGWTECASTFRRLAESERRTCSEVIECLRVHLERRASLTTGLGA
jgi:rubrerythrin